MGVEIAEQTWLFLLAALCGAGVGLLFDLFRALRCVGGERKGLVIMEDVLFWLLALGMIFALVLILSDGILRGFQILGLLLGTLIYYLLLSRGALWLLTRLFGAVGWVFGKLFSAVRRFVLSPLWKMWRLLRRFGCFLGRKLPIPKKRSGPDPVDTQNI